MTTPRHAELLKFDGVGRNILERRIVALVDALQQIEERMQARIVNAASTAALHAEPVVREAAIVRGQAYATALADVQDLLADCP